MLRIKWPIALATLFVLLLGWYLYYTQQIYQRAQFNSQLLSQIFSEVQEGLLATDEGAETQALFNMQQIITRSGVPLVVTGPADTVLFVENLPFEVDVDSPAGQERVQAYVAVLDAQREPIGTVDQMIHYGESVQDRNLRLIPWLQVGGLLFVSLIGFLVIRYQRRAEGEKAWTAMARELAHQLGTPLSSLAGWLEVLRLPHGERPGDLSDGEIAGSIGEDLERLERISHRFELIGTDPELEALALRDIVRDLEHYLAARIPRLARQRVDLLVDIPPRLPPVLANHVLLIWALENVVKNALDALAGRGGKITIYARAVGPSWISLRIRDTGPGIDPDIRDKIFEPGVTTKSGGWGVGLALSRRIVEGVHGGRIELLESTEGTTFQIRLPIAHG